MWCRSHSSTTLVLFIFGTSLIDVFVCEKARIRIQIKVWIRILIQCTVFGSTALFSIFVLAYRVKLSKLFQSPNASPCLLPLDYAAMQLYALSTKLSWIFMCSVIAGFNRNQQPFFHESFWRNSVVRKVLHFIIWGVAL